MSKKQQNGISDTREKLMRLAARSFGTQGYSATSMRSIADQAGIEVASIYYHFTSKEALADEVMAHGAESIVQHLKNHLEALPSAATAEDRLRAAVRGYMNGLVEFGDYALGQNRLLVQLPQSVKERQIERREHHQTLWDALLEDMRKDGTLRDDANIRLCRVFLLSCMNTLPTWFDPQKGSLEAVADHICTIFLDGAKVKADCHVRA